MSTQSALRYNDIISILKAGLEFDEQKNYPEAKKRYEAGLQLIHRVLSSRDASSFTDSQLSSLKKHQDMFHQRLQEVNTLIGESTQATNSKGWLQSVVSFFNPSPTNQASTKAPHAQPQVQPQVQSHVSYQDTTNSIFQPFRKQAGRSILRLSEDDFTVNTRSYAFDSRDEVPQKPFLSNPSSKSFSTSNTTSNITSAPKPPMPSSSTPNLSGLLNSPELKGVDKNLLSRILDDVVETAPQVSFDDIGGLDYAKQVLRETVIFPQLRPDLFNGLRTPTRGILLHGPPGTGKTLLARCVASNVKATFFNISASSLNSKFHGEGEKIVKALFAAARFLAPSVIFIDEVDSILTTRSDSEHEASRRLKTQILIELDGIIATPNEPNKHMLVMAATNRPHELDDAALRRFPKRIFISLPEEKVRSQIIKNVLKKGGQHCQFSEYDFQRLAKLTEGYSGSDLNELCREAVMIPLREVGDKILKIKPSDVRPVQMRDFEEALTYIKPTANAKLLATLEKWNEEFGGGK